MWGMGVMLIALAKSRNARGASYQPASMSSCLAISHTCFVYHVEERCYFGVIYMSLGGW